MLIFKAEIRSPSRDLWLRMKSANKLLLRKPITYLVRARLTGSADAANLGGKQPPYYYRAHLDNFMTGIYVVSITS
jgi:hypothetical protein